MPQPGEAIPYPPHPAFGGASGQYALETTLLRIADQILGAEGNNAPALPAGGVGALARLRQILDQLQAGGEVAKDLTLQQVVTQLLALVGKDFATQTTLAAVGAVLVAAEAARDVDATALQTRADLLATEATLAAMSAKLPATLGQKSSAASGATVLSTEQELLLALRNNAFATLEHYLPRSISDEMRADEVSTDRYHGRAPDGTATNAAAWEVVRFYKDANDNIIRTRYRTGVAWDSRAAGW